MKTLESTESIPPLPQLAYGTVDTQFGVTCEDRPDGGIVVTIPSTPWRYALRRVPPAHPLLLVVTLGWYFVEKLINRPLPARAVIELTAEHLSITQPEAEARDQIVTRTWPLIEVGEIRPNRYSRGLYVRIPGKENFDMLGDLNQTLVQYVGNKLNDALARVRIHLQT